MAFKITIIMVFTLDITMFRSNINRMSTINHDIIICHISSKAVTF